MGQIKIGNAPVSWGVEEIPDWGPQLPVDRVLGEMKKAGYLGTELGPWGYMPSEYAPLKELLGKYGLVMVSAFCPINLHTGLLNEFEISELRKEAKLLVGMGSKDIIIADSGSDSRYKIAGRVEAEAGDDKLDETLWKKLGENLKIVTDICRGYGLTVSFHPHVGTYIETADEIKRFGEETKDLGLLYCLDTGHLAYAGADPVALFKEHAGRLGVLHLKDVNLELLAECRAKGYDFITSTRQGVFVPLGKGHVDYPSIFGTLRDSNYSGWVIVEQDRVLTEKDNPLEDAIQSISYLRKFLP
ncbi:MAG: sugar phosphate isomerase/epimerase family protein [Eubacteriales bacterium]